MRSVIAAAIVVVLLAAAFYGRPAWTSEDGQPIAVRLSSPKTEYTFGETIAVTLTIANTSETTKTLALGRVSGRGVYGLRILEGAGGAQAKRHDARHMTGGLLVLRPKESVNFLYSGLQLQPGDHVIHAEYELAEAMIDPLEEELSDLWTGKVTSNDLHLVVKEQPLTAELQAEFDRRMQRLLGVVRDSTPELRQHLLWYLSTYMPLTREYLRAMLDDEDYYLRASVVSVVCQLAAPTTQTIPQRKDVSLLPDVLKMLKNERIPLVKQAAAGALGWAAPALSEDQRKEAAAILSPYVEKEDGEFAGWAATSLLKVDPQQAVPAIRKKLEHGGERDRQFMNLLQQALKKQTGTSDVTEALRRIEQGLEQPAPAGPEAAPPPEPPKQ